MPVFPPKRILVAFDFSGRSFRAWDYAQAWARRCGAGLEAVHVNRWTREASGAFVSEALRNKQLRAIETAMARLLPASRLRVAEGDVVEQILRAARELRADMIIMATEGRTGLRALKRPSVTEEVVRRSPVPVLALRHAVRSVPAELTPPGRSAPSARPRRSSRKRGPRALRAPAGSRGSKGRNPSSTRPARPGTPR